MAGKEDQATEKAGAAGGNKMLLIVAGAVIVVVIAATAVIVMAGRGDKGEKSEKTAASAEKKGEHGGKGGVSSNIVPLDPFIVNIYDGQDIRYLKVKVEFELAAADGKDEIEARQAPLRDAILVLLTTKTLKDIQDLQGKNQLREEILASANKILTPGKIAKVYFTDFVVQ